MELSLCAANLQDGLDYPAVLATLVSVEGSSYRRTGARLLLSARGEHWGAISGGCLEEDLISRAHALRETDQRHELVSYDTTDENDLLWGVGTGCHGIVKILLEVLPAPPPWLQAVIEVRALRRHKRLATVWQPRPDGSPLGTTLIQARTFHHVGPPLVGVPQADGGLRGSGGMPASGSPTLRGVSNFPLEREISGLASAGPTEEAGVLVQDLFPPWHLVVFGAGDDTGPLVDLARVMDWRVTVVDPRPGKATAERFPQADEVRCLPCPDAITAITWDDRTLAVVMTHHYVHDLPLLRALIPLHLPFIGLLGPRERGRRLLRDAGFANDEPRVTTLHSPVGLDLGGDGPQAVALSIMAEIQATLHQRNARPLRDRLEPIHHDA